MLSNIGENQQKHNTKKDLQNGKGTRAMMSILWYLWYIFILCWRGRLACEKFLLLCWNCDVVNVGKTLCFWCAQRKNHTGRNSTVKAHVNGIKKAKDYASKSLKGVSRTSWIGRNFADDCLTCRWTPNSSATLDFPRSTTKRTRLPRRRPK